MDSLLTPKETARMLRCSTRTLENWRNRGYGPRSILVGYRWMYLKSDVAAFIDEAVSEADRANEAMRRGTSHDLAE